MSEAALAAEALGRRVGDLEIVGGVSLTVRAGEWVSLLGPSGSGKTTLLYMLGLLDCPTAGRVLLGSRDAWSLGPRQRARARLAELGFVFQTQNLLGHLSARDNVALPHWRLHGSRRRALEEADAALARFGLSHRADTRAGLLSMGEGQRAAIARALVNHPAVVLADEPTGSLDSGNGARVLAALSEVCAAGAGLLVVTHDPSVAARGRELHLRDGKLT